MNIKELKWNLILEWIPLSLKKYKEKRNLRNSQEPSGSKKSSCGGLHFCVQKHAARRLHYDFRLEYRGVLLSWAVPKGPSLSIKDKRLAIKVEDHPLDYQYFEGIIPKGNYGAGTVERWDWGTYSAIDAKTIKETEKILTLGLEKGHFTIVLNGKKLKGAFTFQKLNKDPMDASWLLIKKEDETGIFNQKSKPPSPHLKSSGQSAKMPDFISPMLATLVRTSFNSEDWLFEIKWDGYRALAFIRLLSKPHLVVKIAIFGIFIAKFFNHIFIYAFKICR